MIIDAKKRVIRVLRPAELHAEREPPLSGEQLGVADETAEISSRLAECERVIAVLEEQMRAVSD